MELILKRANEPPRTLALTGEQLLIGRDPDCDLSLSSRYVSHHHAELMRQGTEYVIIDAGSRNGTFVNGRRLKKGERRRLKKGDEIAIADFLLTCWEPPEDGATETYEGVIPDELHVDIPAREVWLGLRKLEARLSVQEFALLAFLYENSAKVCSREEIGERVWGSEIVGGRSLAKYDDNMIHRLVFRLKAKLEEGLGAGGRIVNVPGVGYKLER